MAPDALPPRPFPLGARGLSLVLIAAAGVASFVALDLDASDLLPREGNHDIGAFFSRAFSPAVAHETEFQPEVPFLVMSLEAAWQTLLVAAAAMGLSLVIGVVLGFLASTAWWRGEMAGVRGSLHRVVSRFIAPAVYGIVRVLIALMRSVHELLWALLLLIAFGLDATTAIIAIAIPYGGTLAKIFSEVIDEAPRGPALALRAAGASGIQVYTLGLAPPAIPDMIAYGFYRFECALRSSAILGFFGLGTLGVYIRDSFNYGHYGETWTHLYMLIAMVVVFDAWSGAIRRRLVR